MEVLLEQEKQRRIRLLLGEDVQSLYRARLLLKNFRQRGMGLILEEDKHIGFRILLEEDKQRGIRLLQGEEKQRVRVRLL